MDWRKANNHTCVAVDQQGEIITDRTATETYPAHVESRRKASLRLMHYSLKPLVLLPLTALIAQPTIAQVTSVSQLSDVQPTDWAFQALQSLTERYGCIAGYPDGTYRGNQALTRYEFAAGLNACLDQILAQVGGDGLDPADLDTIQRLQDDFANQLTEIRGRVDSLDSRLESIEAQQFSTTTKLEGEAIFNVGVALGNDGDEQVNFQDRVRLDFNTSFNGRDRLTTSLQAGNSDPYRLSGNNDGINFGDSAEGTLASQAFGSSNNDVRIEKLAYTTTLGDNLDVTIGVNGTRFADFVPTLNPYFGDNDGGNGALSAFGQYNPIYRLGGGAGIGLNWRAGEDWQFSTGYLTSNASDSSSGNGFFDGDVAILAQAAYTPSEKFGAALTYNYGYFTPGGFAFNNGGGNFDDTGFGFTGTRMANGIGTTSAVNSHSLGLNLSFEIASGLHLTSWVGYTGINLDAAENDLNGDIWNGAIGVALPDLGGEGNLGGLLVGIQPMLTDLENSNEFFKDNAAWHLEAFYKLSLNENISLTPGLIWLPNPNQDNGNDDTIILTLRTTFTF